MRTVISVVAPITRVRDGKDIKLSFYVRIFNAFHEYATEEEFGELTLQTYFDILLTTCYDVEDNRGLGEMWDAVNEVIKSLDVFEYGEVPVLGYQVEINSVIVDPGMEGLGIIDGDEVAEILERLKENRDEAESAEPEDLLYEAEPEEWMEAYDDLCSLYEDALSQKKGLLLTF